MKATMSSVRTRGTEPELWLRRQLSSRGMRYRLNARALPGKPDVYVGRIKLAIFIHGCFWHRHDCSRGKLPATNQRFWREKLETNARRDTAVCFQLEARGIRVLTLWWCEREFYTAVIDHIAAQYDAAAAASASS